ncbi:hypothetical protein Vafri_1880, partial [Volvox africanus]
SAAKATPLRLPRRRISNLLAAAPPLPPAIAASSSKFSTPSATGPGPSDASPSSLRRGLVVALLAAAGAWASAFLPRWILLSSASSVARRGRRLLRRREEP